MSISIISYHILYGLSFLIVLINKKTPVFQEFMHKYGASDENRTHVVSLEG